MLQRLEALLERPPESDWFARIPADFADRLETPWSSLWMLNSRLPGVFGVRVECHGSDDRSRGRMNAFRSPHAPFTSRYDVTTENLGNAVQTTRRYNATHSALAVT